MCVCVCVCVCVRACVRALTAQSNMSNMTLLFIKILPENHKVIFGFSRKVAKFQDLLMQASKATLKDITDRVLGTFYKVCLEKKKKNHNQLHVSF